MNFGGFWGWRENDMQTVPQERSLSRSEATESGMLVPRGSGFDTADTWPRK